MFPDHSATQQLAHRKDMREHAQLKSQQWHLIRQGIRRSRQLKHPNPSL